MKLDGKKQELLPRTLKERYEYIFQVKDLKNEKTPEVLQKLFQAVDVKILARHLQKQITIFLLPEQFSLGRE